MSLRNELMYRVEIAPSGLEAIDIFIRSYEDGFIELYEDSGIWSEDLILANYHAAALELYRTIKVKMIGTLMQPTIFGTKRHGNFFEVAFMAQKRLVTVLYRDLPKESLRIIDY